MVSRKRRTSKVSRANKPVSGSILATIGNTDKITNPVTSRLDRQLREGLEVRNLKTLIADNEKTRRSTLGAANLNTQAIMALAESLGTIRKGEGSQPNAIMAGFLEDLGSKAFGGVTKAITDTLSSVSLPFTGGAYAVTEEALRGFGALMKQSSKGLASFLKTTDQKDIKKARDIYTDIAPKLDDALRRQLKGIETVLGANISTILKETLEEAFGSTYVAAAPKRFSANVRRLRSDVTKRQEAYRAVADEEMLKEAPALRGKARVAASTLKRSQSYIEKAPDKAAAIEDRMGSIAYRQTQVGNFGSAAAALMTLTEEEKVELDRIAQARSKIRGAKKEYVEARRDYETKLKSYTDAESIGFFVGNPDVEKEELLNLQKAEKRLSIAIGKRRNLGQTYESIASARGNVASLAPRIAEEREMLGAEPPVVAATRESLASLRSAQLGKAVDPGDISIREAVEAAEELLNAAMLGALKELKTIPNRVKASKRIVEAKTKELEGLGQSLDQLDLIGSTDSLDRLVGLALEEVSRYTKTPVKSRPTITLSDDQETARYLPQGNELVLPRSYEGIDLSTVSEDIVKELVRELTLAAQYGFGDATKYGLALGGRFATKGVSPKPAELERLSPEIERSVIKAKGEGSDEALTRSRYTEAFTVADRLSTPILGKIGRPQYIRDYEASLEDLDLATPLAELTKLKNFYGRVTEKFGFGDAGKGFDDAKSRIVDTARSYASKAEALAGEGDYVGARRILTELDAFLKKAPQLYIRKAVESYSSALPPRREDIPEVSEPTPIPDARVPDTTSSSLAVLGDTSDHASTAITVLGDTSEETSNALAKLNDAVKGLTDTLATVKSGVEAIKDAGSTVAGVGAKVGSALVKGASHLTRNPGDIVRKPVEVAATGAKDTAIALTTVAALSQIPELGSALDALVTLANHIGDTTLLPQISEIVSQQGYHIIDALVNNPLSKVVTSLPGQGHLAGDVAQLVSKLSGAMSNWLAHTVSSGAVEVTAGSVVVGGIKLGLDNLAKALENVGNRLTGRSDKPLDSKALPPGNDRLKNAQPLQDRIGVPQVIQDQLSNLNEVKNRLTDLAAKVAAGDVDPWMELDVELNKVALQLKDTAKNTYTSIKNADVTAIGDALTEAVDAYTSMMDAATDGLGILKDKLKESGVDVTSYTALGKTLGSINRSYGKQKQQIDRGFSRKTKEADGTVTLDVAAVGVQEDNTLMAAYGTDLDRDIGGSLERLSLVLGGIAGVMSELEGAAIDPTNLNIEVLNTEGYSAGYDPATATLKVGRDIVAKVGKGSVDTNTLKTLIHELRHAVQHGLGGIADTLKTYTMQDLPDSAVKEVSTLVESSTGYHGGKPQETIERVRRLETDAYVYTELHLKEFADSLQAATVATEGSNGVWGALLEFGVNNRSKISSVATDLAVNTAGFAASSAMSDSGMALAADLLAALVARVAAQKSRDAVLNYRQLAGTDQFASAGVMGKLKMLFQAHDADPTTGNEELTGDILGWAVGNAVAQAVTSVIGHAIPFSGAVAAMGAVPAYLSHQRQVQGQDDNVLMSAYPENKIEGVYKAILKRVIGSVKLGKSLDSDLERLEREVDGLSESKLRKIADTLGLSWVADFLKTASTAIATATTNAEKAVESSKQHRKKAVQAMAEIGHVVEPRNLDAEVEAELAALFNRPVRRVDSSYRGSRRDAISGVDPAAEGLSSVNMQESIDAGDMPDADSAQHVANAVRLLERINDTLEVFNDASAAINVEYDKAVELNPSLRLRDAYQPADAEKIQKLAEEFTDYTQRYIDAQVEYYEKHLDEIPAAQKPPNTPNRGDLPGLSPLAALGDVPGNLVASGAKIAALIALTKSLRGVNWDLVASYESVRVALDRVSGVGSFDKVSKAAQKYGIDLRDLARTSAQVASNLQGTAFESQAIELAQELPKVRQLLSLTAEEFDRFMSATNQAQTKGKLMTEEYRGQFGDIPGATSLIAKARGQSLSDLNQQVASGNAYGDVLVELSRYLKTVDVDTDTLASSQERLANSIERVEVARGQVTIGLEKTKNNFLAFALESVEGLAGLAEMAIATVASLLTLSIAVDGLRLIKTVSGFKAVSVALSGLTTAMPLLGTGLTAVTKFMAGSTLVTFGWIAAITAGVLAVGNLVSANHKLDAGTRSYSKSVSDLTTKLNVLNKVSEETSKGLKFTPSGDVAGAFDWVSTLGRNEYKQEDIKALSDLGELGNKAGRSWWEGFAEAVPNPVDMLTGNWLNKTLLPGQGRTFAGKQLENILAQNQADIQQQQQNLIAGESGALFSISNAKGTTQDGTELRGNALFAELKRLDDEINDRKLQIATMKAQGLPSSAFANVTREMDDLSNERVRLGSQVFGNLSTAEEGAKGLRDRAKALRELAKEHPVIATQLIQQASMQDKLAERVENATKKYRAMTTEISNAAAVMVELDKVQRGLDTTLAENDLALATGTRYTSKSQGQESVAATQVTNLQSQRQKIEKDVAALIEATSKTARLLTDKLNDRVKADIDSALAPMGETLDTLSPEDVQSALNRLPDLSEEYKEIITAAGNQKSNLRQQARLTAELNGIQVQIEDAQIDAINQQRQFEIQRQQFWEDYNRAIEESNLQLSNQIADIQAQTASLQLDTQLSSQLSEMRSKIGKQAGSLARELRNAFVEALKLTQDAVRANLQGNQGIASSLRQAAQQGMQWQGEDIGRARQAQGQLSSEAEYKYGTAEGRVPRNLPSLPPIPGYSNVGGKPLAVPSVPPLGRGLKGSLPPMPGSAPKNPATALKPLLDLIYKYEGGYNSYNRGRAGDSPGDYPGGLVNRTIGEVINLQKQGRAFAVGAPQFIPSTLKSALEGSGLKASDKFSPANQDKLAITLILGGSKRPTLSKYLKGGNVSLDAAQDDLAYEWASMPGSGGSGKYNAIGGNKSADHLHARVRQLLANARAVISGQTPNITPVPPSNALNVPDFSEQRSGLLNSQAGLAEAQSQQGITGAANAIRDAALTMGETFSDQIRGLQDRLGQSLATVQQDELILRRSRTPLPLENADVEFASRKQELDNRIASLTRDEADLMDAQKVIRDLTELVNSGQLDPALSKVFQESLPEISRLFAENSKAIAESLDRLRKASPGDVQRTVLEATETYRKNRVSREREDAEASVLRTGDDQYGQAVADIRRNADLSVAGLPDLVADRRKSLESDLANLRTVITLGRQNGATQESLNALEREERDINASIAEIQNDAYLKSRENLVRQQEELDIARERRALEDRTRNAGIDLQRRDLQADIDNPFAMPWEKEADQRSLAILDYQQQIANIPQILRDLNLGLKEGTAEWERYRVAMEGVAGEELQNKLRGSFEVINTVGSAVATAFTENFAQIFQGQVSVLEGLRGMALGILQSVNQYLQKLLQQVIISGLSKLLFNLVNPGGGALGAIGGGAIGGGKSLLSGALGAIGGFSDGGEVSSNSSMPDTATMLGLSAMRALRREGSNSVLAALTPGEQVLTDKNKDATVYRQLKSTGQWDALKTTVGNYANGGTVGGFGMQTTSSRPAKRTTAPTPISVTVYAKDAASFRASRAQIATEMAIAYDKAKAQNA